MTLMVFCKFQDPLGGLWLDWALTFRRKPPPPSSFLFPFLLLMAKPALLPSAARDDVLPVSLPHKTTLDLHPPAKTGGRRRIQGSVWSSMTLHLA